MSFFHKSLFAAVLSVASCVASCSSDPVYVQPSEALEAGTDSEDPDNPGVFTQITLPVRLETDLESSQRQALQDSLGVPVPFVKLNDLRISIEWTVKNLSEAEAKFHIDITGANERFEYVPANFVFDVDEEPTPPPLFGGIPLLIPPLGTLSGVFREDEIREASIDLELITQGGLNPFAALLALHEETKEITTEDGTLPLRAFASMIRFDIGLISDQHIVMEYVVRVRSERVPHLLHEEGLFADAGELTVFAPATFTPPPPVEE